MIRKLTCGISGESHIAHGKRTQYTSSFASYRRFAIKGGRASCLMILYMYCHRHALERHPKEYKVENSVKSIIPYLENLQSDIINATPCETSNLSTTSPNMSLMWETKARHASRTTPSLCFIYNAVRIVTQCKSLEMVNKSNDTERSTKRFQEQRPCLV